MEMLENFYKNFFKTFKIFSFLETFWRNIEKKIENSNLNNSKFFLNSQKIIFAGN